MENYVITVDGGTTKTKVCLWNLRGEIVEIKTKGIGAKDCAIENSTFIWKNAIHEMIVHILKENKVTIDEVSSIYASGMLTSNLGIYEVPYIEAPVDIKDFYKKTVEVNVSEVSEKEVHLIPGIKNKRAESLKISDLKDSDMMRGEETEVYALAKKYGTEQNTIFILPGSHNKYVYVNSDGLILGSKTTLSGELLTSVVNNTVVSDSVNREFLSMEDYDKKMIISGYKICQKEGIGRALFMTRILDIFGNRNKEELQNYMVGVVLASDVTVLKHGSLFKNDLNSKIVISGNSPICRAFYDILVYEHLYENIVFDKNDDKPIAAQGAYLLANQSK